MAVNDWGMEDEAKVKGNDQKLSHEMSSVVSSKLFYTSEENTWL